MKKRENPPEEELNERKAGNLSDMEFRVMIIRLLNRMKKRHRSNKKGPVRNKECNI